jgi:hypothetical protein
MKNKPVFSHVLFIYWKLQGNSEERKVRTEAFVLWLVNKIKQLSLIQ